MIALVNFAGEGNPFAVRRPAWLVVGFVVIGDLRQRSALSRDHPHVRGAVLVVLLAGAIRNEREARSVRRPPRIAVVPPVAFGNLFCAACLHRDNPQMRASIVEPTGVVEFVRSVFVMTHVAAVFVIGATVTGADPTDDHESTAVRRPAKRAYAVLEIRDTS